MLSASCSRMPYVHCSSCVIYAFPQLNDMDYKLSQNCGFPNGDMKKEYSLDFSHCSKDEGNPGLQIPLVLYCVYLYAFILI